MSEGQRSGFSDRPGNFVAGQRGIGRLVQVPFQGFGRFRPRLERTGQRDMPLPVEVTGKGHDIPHLIPGAAGKTIRAAYFDDISGTFDGDDRITDTVRCGHGEMGFGRLAKRRLQPIRAPLQNKPDSPLLP